MSRLDPLSHYERIYKLQSIVSILYWDNEVGLPEKSQSFRNDQITALSSEIHKLACDPEFIESITSFPSGIEPHHFRNLQRFAFRKAAVQPDLFKSLIKAELAATEKWKEAKDRSDFSLVAPLLGELVKLRIEAANQMKDYPHLKSDCKDLRPYDIMLDGHEPGLTSEDLKAVFVPLKTGLLKIIESLDLEQSSLPVIAAPQFSMRNLVHKFGFDFTKGRLDLTKSYPFCGGHPGDVRITTRSNGDFCDNLLTTMHELGHGLYEQNLPETLIGTPSGMGASTGFHESQSRFYENQIGRSDAFISYISKTTQIPINELYPHFRSVKVEAIRAKADELHYNLHVILRWEIEQALIEGNLKVKDIPQVWNLKMKEYLNIEVQNDSEGCVQDVHWFLSDFGWFPTYSLGNLIAAQLYADFKIEYPDWENEVESGNFLFIKGFLSKVHKLGATQDFKGTLQSVCGSPHLSEKPLLQYLTERFAKRRSL